MIKFFSCIMTVIFMFSGCDHTQNSRRHDYIEFKNKSDRTIVIGTECDYLKYGGYAYNSYAKPEWRVFLYAPDRSNSWEDIFGNFAFNINDTLDIWIGDDDVYTSIRNDNEIQRALEEGSIDPKVIYERYLLQEYHLTLSDLQILQFELAYPPSPEMRHIQMRPSYEEAIAGKTFQDLPDMEQ